MFIRQRHGFPASSDLLENLRLMPIVAGEAFAIRLDHLPDDSPLIRIEINAIVAAGGSARREFADLQRHLERIVIQHRLPHLAGEFVLEGTEGDHAEAAAAMGNLAVGRFDQIPLSVQRLSRRIE